MTKANVEDRVVSVKDSEPALKDFNPNASCQGATINIGARGMTKMRGRQKKLLIFI